MRLLAMGIPVLAALGLVAAALRPAPALPAVIESDPTSAPATPAPLVVVDVTGAVARPGVVRLPAGARILDALLAAGGMTGEADLFALNKAAPLRDGMRIYVPRPGEAVPAGSLGSSAESKIDLNAATVDELDALPGVGPATAARIVRSRGSRPFAKVEDLQTRGLVTPRVLADIRDLVTVR